MIKQAEPDLSAPTLNDWGQEIADRQFASGGFIMLQLSEMNTAAAPVIQTGSRVEVNSTLYKAQVNESISGTPAVNAQNYIYVVPGTDAATTQYSTAAPAWSAAKGGWYNGNNRAIAKLFYTGGNYNGKVILDSFNAMQMINREQPVPTSDKDGLLVLRVNTPSIGSIVLRGMYKIRVKAGKGGTGGTGGHGYYENVGGYGTIVYNYSGGNGGVGGTAVALATNLKKLSSIGAAGAAGKGGVGDNNGTAGTSGVDGTGVEIIAFFDDLIEYELSGDGGNGTNGANATGAGNGASGAPGGNLLTTTGYIEIYKYW
jgi:hypothetical protein